MFTVAIEDDMRQLDPLWLLHNTYILHDGVNEQVAQLRNTLQILFHLQVAQLEGTTHTLQPSAWSSSHIPHKEE